MTRRLHKRRDAPEQRGLHIAGIDGSFSDAVESNHPRCPECRVLFAAPTLLQLVFWLDPNAPSRLCDSCRKAYEAAAEESRRRAELRGGAA